MAEPCNATGANDCVTWPFGIGELLARVRAALRQAGRPPGGGLALRFGTPLVDLDARTARRGDNEVRLTPVEFRLLAALAKRAGTVATHRVLLTEVWGPSHERDTHHLRVYMKPLRDELEDDPERPRCLLTETGVGYRLLVDE